MDCVYAIRHHFWNYLFIMRTTQTGFKLIIYYTQYAKVGKISGEGSTYRYLGHSRGLERGRDFGAMARNLAPNGEGLELGNQFET